MHRDVKPQNVLLNGDGDAKVTDFGIARSLDVEHGVTQTGTVLGTSNYLSPEQASGKHGRRRATDVYSLGVVLYELLTGEVPFPGENFVAVAMKHVNEPPPTCSTARPDVPLAARGGGRARDGEGSGASASRRWTTSRRSCGRASPSSARRTRSARSSRRRPVRASRAASRARAAAPLAVARRCSRCSVARRRSSPASSRSAARRGTSDAGGGRRRPARPIALHGVARYDPRRTATASTTRTRRRRPTATRPPTGRPSTTASRVRRLRTASASCSTPARGVARSASPSRRDTPGFTAEIQAGQLADGPVHRRLSVAGRWARRRRSR